MDTFSKLRKTENIFYPPTLQIAVKPTSEETIAPQASPVAQPVDTIVATSEPTKETKAEHSNPPPIANL